MPPRRRHNLRRSDEAVYPYSLANALSPTGLNPERLDGLGVD